MCSDLDCNCNKLHQKCLQFINFEYLKITFKEYQNQSLKDIFQKLIYNLEEIARTAIKNYNSMVNLYETYSFPEPISNVY